MLLQSDKIITSNPYLSINFIKPEIFYIDLEPFLLAINLDVMSSFNIFISLIYIFRCKDITILNQ